MGGDVAVLKGMMKAVIEADDAAHAADDPRVLDIEFIEAIRTVSKTCSPTCAPPLGRDRAAKWLVARDIQNAADIYMEAKNAILVFGMGLTQHHHGTENVQQVANLALLRGNIGRPGAGVCPVRGHSNVQGDRTVGITEKPSGS